MLPLGTKKRSVSRLTKRASFVNMLTTAWAAAHILAVNRIVLANALMNCVR